MPIANVSCSGIKIIIGGLNASEDRDLDRYIRPRYVKLIAEEPSQCLKRIFENSLRKL